MKKTNQLAILSLVALAISLNFVGGFIALRLQLPIYLDTLGTILASILLGPIWGVVTAILSALLSAVTAVDYFGLFYAPVAIVIALLSAYMVKPTSKLSSIWWRAFVVALPATIVSSLITMIISNGTGATSSGSSIVVQVLYGIGIPRHIGIIIMQSLTDYSDRLLTIFTCLLLVQRLPKHLVLRFKP